jgi:hypothetical protein
MEQDIAKAVTAAQAGIQTGIGATTPLMPDVRNGLGARLDTSTRAAKRTLLLDMALGVFTSAGVTHLRVQREADVSNLGDLLLYSLDELETIAAEKGGIRTLLDENWRKVYQTNAPRGLFTQGECAPREGGIISDDR